MRRFGLVGYPLGHSFSKKYFTEKFLKENLSDCVYENYPLESIDQLPSLVSSENPDGLNVTIPYKSEVIRFLDRIDDEAALIGAVNVIKVIKTGSRTFLHGYNSDVTGIHLTLEPFAGMQPRHAIVLGSGGSSRAVCHVLEKLGFSFSVVSRKSRPGYITYDQLDYNIFRETGLIINTTPLGMYPDIDSKPPINYDYLDSWHVLFDLVYNPEYTSFLREGRKRGCTVLTGLAMLYSQAEKSWEIWTNSDV